MKWSSAIVQYWGKCPWLYTDEDVQDAANELRTFFESSPPTNDEIVAAIRYMAGPEVKQEKCPNLRELIRGICLYRRSLNDAKAGELKSCSHCHEGWVEFWPTLDEKATYKQMATAVVQVSPCTCKAGQAVKRISYKHATAEQLEHYTKCAIKGIKQCQHAKDVENGVTGRKAVEMAGVVDETEDQVMTNAGLLRSDEKPGDFFGGEE